MKQGFLIGAFLALTCCAALAQVQDAPIDAQKIEHFDLADPLRKRFGSMEFTGGLVLSSTNQHLGSISGLRVGDGGRFTAVADTGFWFQGRIERDGSGAPVGIAEGRIAPILDADGQAFPNKWSSDTEGLTFAGDAAYVSAEGDMRVLRFGLGEGPPGSELLTTPSQRITGDIPPKNLDFSFSFESIAALPPGNPMAPGLLLIAENDESGGGEAPAYILKDGKLLPLAAKQSDGFFFTDADFLPNGDLLVLERKFTMGTGQGMRIRKIAGDSIKPGALLDGEVVLLASAGQQIDNMEALSVFSGPDGGVRIGLMSDDNHWLMQRTLYLEFAYLP